jgi:outer membrane protein OmpA-like peptidoglycan-associated protein
VNKNIAAWLCMGPVAMGGCGSAPKPVIPDGSARTPVNTEAKILDYKARTSEEESNYRERSALSRQVESLNREIYELKTYLVQLAGAREPAAARRKGQTVATPGKPVATPPPRIASSQEQTGATVPLKTESPRKPQQVAERETMEVREQSVLFRVMQPADQTAFTPSRVLQQHLLTAAKSARRIEIRGRTDVDEDSEAARRTASERARQARLFLVKHGIAPSKIDVSFMGSGGLVATNATPEGKALNRRVEIDAMDLNTQTFRDNGSMKVGSAP